MDTQSTSGGGVSMHTPTFAHPFLSSKRLQELNAIDAVEYISTCTGTTMVGELNK